MNITFAVTVSTEIQTTRAKLWDAWTSAKNHDAWFSSSTELDCRVGGAYRNADLDHGVFTRVEPVCELEFTWDNAEHHPGSLVTVRLESVENVRVRCSVTQSLLATAEATTQQEDGWTWALTSLKSWLETGRNVTYEAWKAAEAAGDSSADAG